MAKTLRGTAAQLSKFVAINGHLLTVTEWSVMTRFLEQAEKARIVGEQKPTSGKGRSSKIWEIDTKITLNVEELSK